MCGITSLFLKTIMNKKLIVGSFTIAALILLCNGYLLAAPHKNGNNSGPREYVVPLSRPLSAAEARTGRYTIHVGSVSSSVGVKKVAVILVDFPIGNTYAISGAPTMTAQDILSFNTTM